MMKQSKLRALILSLCALLIFGGAVKAVWAKYVKDTTLSGSVNIQANLGNLSVQEHLAVDLQGDGTYELDLDNIVLSNTYETVMPGVDIPKDPYVTITDKSSIPAYLFVEVVDTLPNSSGITYAIDSSNWLSLGISGKNGGTVYVYQGGTGSAVSITNTTPNMDDISILSGDMVYVSQSLNVSSQINIYFHVSLLQVAAGNSVEAVYNTLPDPTP